MTPVAVAEQEREADPGFVDGLLLFEAQEVIHALVARHGYEQARDEIAVILNELDNRISRS